MNHPLPEELFDSARANDRAPFAAHLDTCAECRAAWDRLRTGATLLNEASEDPALDAIDWGRIDAAVSAEAERVAAGIRAGTIRAPRPWKAYALGGLALAAAASAIAYVRTHPSQDDLVARTDVTAPPAAPPVAQPSTPAPAARFEGAVLLAAGGAMQTPASGAAQRIASGAPLREGARVITTAAGRAVFSVQPAVALDVRGDSDVTLSALREGAATVTLAQGEVAVDREGEAGSVSLRAGRWQVGAEGDVVARVESHAVRVVVLSGRATVEADGVSQMQFSGPVVIELPDVGAPHAVPGDATDARHIDLSMLSADGTMWALPPIDPAASLSVRGRGALPSSLESLRVPAPVTLQARVGHTIMTLEVGSGRVLAWHPAAMVAAAQPTVRRSPQQAPSAVQSPAPQGPTLNAMQLRVASQTVQGRLSHCFRQCREQNRCPAEMRGVVEVSVDPNGRVSLASLDPSANGARACLANEVTHMRLPAIGTSYPFRVQLR